MFELKLIFRARPDYMYQFIFVSFASDIGLFFLEYEVSVRVCARDRVSQVSLYTVFNPWRHSNILWTIDALSFFHLRLSFVVYQCRKTVFVKFSRLNSRLKLLFRFV